MRDNYEAIKRHHAKRQAADFRYGWTLVYGTETPLERPADFRMGCFHVYKRPHLEIFLQACFSWFEVAVWTSASPIYTRGIVRNLFPCPDFPIFVWASDRCTRVYDTELCEYYWRKDLKKIQRKGYSKEAIIVVDDTPQKWERSYGNLVRIAPFEGDPNDDELVNLLLYLEYLRDETYIRRIEKRNWQKRHSSNPP